MIAAVLLATSCVAGMVLVPLGLPGLWVMTAGVLGYGWLTDFRTVGWTTIGIAAGLSLIGEIVEHWVGFKLTQRYGGSKRAGWGAILGGLIGAVFGVPIPIIGSVIGAFVGSFAGAMIFEYTQSKRAGTAVGAGWGALLGRAAAVAAKVAFGLVIIVLAAFAALR